MSDGHASAVSPGMKARLGGWLQLARVSNAPTVATNVFVGAALAGLNISSPDVLLTVGWVCLLYFAGMILNDLGNGVADWRLSIPVILLFLLWTVVALRPIMGAGNTDVGRAIARLLAGITLVDAVFVSTLCEWTFASGDDGVSISMGVIALSPLIACGLMFGLTLVLQRRVQTS